MKILVAEDQDINRFILNRMLMKRGIKATFAKNGQEAYDLLKSESFDFVFMDIQMPFMTGIEVVNLLNQENISTPPIAALTSNTFESLKREALESGMNEVLYKPLCNGTLDDVLVRYNLIAPINSALAI